MSDRMAVDTSVLDDAARTRGIWMFLLLVLPDQATRDAALAPLWRAGLGVTRLFAHALPDYPQLQSRLPAMALPNARDFAARTLCIGNSAWLQTAQRARIRAALRSALGSA